MSCKITFRFKEVKNTKPTEIKYPMATADNRKIIEIVNLTHRFPDGTFGVRDVTINFHTGELAIITGRNGSGKTTLVRHFNGLLKPTSGKVLIDGIAVMDNLKTARKKVGMVFQDADSQIVGETVWDDAVFGPENLKIARERITQRVTSVLTSVGLLEYRHQSPHTLSGGEKRRLAIAGVLAMEPEVIVLDEPFSNLDFPGIRQVLQQLVTLRKQGRTLIVITHDLEKIASHADRVVVMSEGRVVRDGIPADVIPGIEVFGVREPCASLLGKEIPSWLS